MDSPYGNLPARDPSAGILNTAPIHHNTVFYGPKKYWKSSTRKTPQTAPWKDTREVGYGETSLESGVYKIVNSKQ